MDDVDDDKPFVNKFHSLDDIDEEDDKTCEIDEDFFNMCHMEDYGLIPNFGTLNIMNSCFKIYVYQNNLKDKSCIRLNNSLKELFNIKDDKIIDIPLHNFYYDYNDEDVLEDIKDDIKDRLDHICKKIDNVYSLEQELDDFYNNIDEVDSDVKCNRILDDITEMKDEIKSLLN